MNILPDVLGYKLEEAMFLLESKSFEVLVKESIFKVQNQEGRARVIRSRKLSDAEIELIISYF
ncbi:hypothetical protein CACET_c19970 [Clostridium aceticum]|uniref:Uncharacterized protein n=1 Tax=Clostridium aceticum TaxID=84022 RepID=A0A0D8I6S8_9CLOT|nr:hypothetical protein [Clostridium aceticum]AKL95445.1 hypothetical protein CACET_c19970 [Clostridium aceticum]KJF25933.1 hypothetical protein TZ02_15570 [Clostridium aceticum]